MALPKLNSAPIYELSVPSTGQTVSYRPYLVKEEKVLMIAFESGDQKQALKAIVSTIEACIQDPINVSELATFDVEYMFTQIRSKSVGEKSTLSLTCPHCEGVNEYSLDISKIKIDLPETSNIIDLTDSISIEMKYPPYQALMNVDVDADQLTLGMSLLVDSISSIIVKEGLEEERTDTKDVSREEVQEFVDSMTSEQFAKVTSYVSELPSLKHNAVFNCVHCGEENNVVMSGISDFLS